MTATPNLPSNYSNITTTYYLKGEAEIFGYTTTPEWEPDWLTIDSLTGQITGTPPSGRTRTKLYVYAQCGAPGKNSYRSEIYYHVIDLNNPVPTFDENSVTITLSAADVRSTAKVGTVIATLDVSGKFTNPATIGTVTTTVVSDYNGLGTTTASFPYQHTGRSGYSVPMLEFDYTAKTTNSNGTTVGTLSVKLITKTTASVAALKNSGNYRIFYLYATNSYGSGATEVIINYTN